LRRDLDLRFVSVVLRHGARAPLSENFGAHDHKWEYCGQAYHAVKTNIRGLDNTDRPVSQSDERQTKVVFEGGCKKGQLTSVGQLQALQLGDWLRERYVSNGFLPPSYNASALEVRSTNISRTLDTVTGVLTGLYPDAEDPIMIETCDDRREWLYPNHRNCKRLSQLMAQKRVTLEESRMAGSHAALEEKLKTALEVPASERHIRFVEAYDVCKTVLFHSARHHMKMDDGLLRELELVATKQMKAFVAPEDNAEMLSLSIGKVLQDLLQGMERAASGEAESAKTKMKLFSGHDTTLMPLLVALGHELRDWPPFMSNLIFELYWSERDGKHYVKIDYNKEVLRVEGCDRDGYLELGQLNDRLRPFMLQDYSSQCSAVEAATKEHHGSVSKKLAAGVSNGVE